MSYANKTCPVCKAKFHHCSSCGYSYGWEDTYCSETCYMLSDEFTSVEDLFDSLYNSLDDDQKRKLAKLLNANDEVLWKILVKNNLNE